MTTIDKRAICGASNNADLYQTVFGVHGVRYDRLPHALVAQDVPPPYYANLTVLSPHHNETIIRELEHLAKRFDGALGLKDSFCQLDLTRYGFETLFEASWIWRAPGHATAPKDWTIVRDPSDLSRWEDGWKRTGSPTGWRMFPDPFLARDDLFFMGRKTGDRFVAGCIANRSDDAMGLSNVFAEGNAEKAFTEAADAVARIDCDVPVVGYESGPDLNHAKGAGFETVGDLRILVTRNAKF